MGVLFRFVYFPYFMRYLTTRPFSFLNVCSVFTILVLPAGGQPGEETVGGSDDRCLRT